MKTKIYQLIYLVFIATNFIILACADSLDAL